MRRSQLTGRLRLRHLAEVTEAKAAEMDEQRERFERLANCKTRAVSAFNLFQTPPELARRIAGMVPLDGRILEPSAGLGRIYRAVRAMSDSPITLVEIAPQCAEELYRITEADHAAKLVQADFLECTAGRIGTFDAIVMNPPFRLGTDIKHVRHARGLLNPGGWLVSLVANGPKQRAALMPCADAWIDLEPGAFKSEGTNVNAAIVVFQKTAD